MSANPLVARAYNSFRVEPFGLIRKSSSTERLADEIGYYKTVQRDINKAIFFPRVIASHTGDENWLLMERYDYPNLGNYLIGHADRTVNWTTVFDELSMVLSQFETFADTRPADPQYIADMILNKTKREYQALVNQRYDLQYLFSAKSVLLNGMEYDNFEVIWDGVETYIVENMFEYTSSMIHGDMCFSNILYSPDSHIFKFIDPRGSFGKKGIYGDPRYDIAKLYHSVDGGYEYIINDEFSLSGDNNAWNYELNNFDTRALVAFEKKFFETGAFKKKDIKIIQGCIYIGMCARHYDSRERQTAMYLTGVRLLNEAMKL
jgi:hypothetical protein